MSYNRKLRNKLGDYLDKYKVEAKALHDKTGIALSTCYKYKKRELTPTAKNIGKIVKAYPQFSAIYLITDI